MTATDTEIRTESVDEPATTAASVDDASVVATDEPGLWTIISPVNREIYTGMTVSLLSLVAWLGSIMLFLPIAREITADDPDSGRIWLLLAI
ncbi:MAG: hypothetical protein AAGG08_03675, partial [Actinomycetota bacterium]